LLLEGIEMFDSDWDQIALHVATRSKEQCIKMFLELPIEDPYLSMVSNADMGATGGMSQADNPVMSVVAFLSSLVDPKVAKEAAQGINGAIKTANAAVGSAGNKASILANEENTDLHSQVKQIVEAQLKKLESKMAQFDQLEALLESEKRQVEQLKLQLNQERLELAQQKTQLQQAAANQQAGMQVDIPTFGSMGASIVPQDTATAAQMYQQHVVSDGNGFGSM